MDGLKEVKFNCGECDKSYSSGLDIVGSKPCLFANSGDREFSGGLEIVGSKPCWFAKPGDRMSTVSESAPRPCLSFVETTISPVGEVKDQHSETSSEFYASGLEIVGSESCLFAKSGDRELAGGLEIVGSKPCWFA